MLTTRRGRCDGGSGNCVSCDDVFGTGFGWVTGIVIIVTLVLRLCMPNMCIYSVSSSLLWLPNKRFLFPLSVELPPACVNLLSS
jgi:hypothetical protein